MDADEIGAENEFGKNKTLFLHGLKVVDKNQSKKLTLF